MVKPSRPNIGKFDHTYLDSIALRLKALEDTIGGGGGDGTVTSVALSATPTSVFSVSGSPITDSGTLGLSLDDQDAHTVLAGPTSGGPDTPSFRELDVADIQASATDVLYGRHSSGAGVGEEISPGIKLSINGGDLDHDDSAEPAGKTYFSGGWTEYDDQGHRIDEQSDPFSNGEGLVIGRSSTARSITSISFMYTAEALSNKVYILCGGATGVLHYVDPIVQETVEIASYAAKATDNMIYSGTSGLLYINYGTNVMSVNPTTGAIVTSGITTGMRLGMCIRPSSGRIYGGNSTSGDIDMVDSSTDTDAGTINGSLTLNSASRKALCYCPTNDSVYAQASTSVMRFDNTDTEAAAISLAGLTGGSGAGCAAYCAFSDKVYCVVNNAKVLSQIDPGSDTEEASYAFPPGTAGSGSGGITVLGRYLYIGVAAGATPSETLVFDTQEEEFIGCLNNSAGAAVNGLLMCGVLGAGVDDTLLYQASTNWYVIGGRL